MSDRIKKLKRTSDSRERKANLREGLILAKRSRREVREYQVATNLSILRSSRLAAAAAAAAAARLCLWWSCLARKHRQPPRLPILLTLLHIPIGLILVKHAACA
jgi:hypothetical protein